MREIFMIQKTYKIPGRPEVNLHAVEISWTLAGLIVPCIVIKASQIGHGFSWLDLPEEIFGKLRIQPREIEYLSEHDSVQNITNLTFKCYGYEQTRRTLSNLVKEVGEDFANEIKPFSVQIDKKLHSIKADEEKYTPLKDQFRILWQEQKTSLNTLKFKDLQTTVPPTASEIKYDSKRTDEKEVQAKLTTPGFKTDKEISSALETILSDDQNKAKQVFEPFSQWVDNLILVIKHLHSPEKPTPGLNNYAEKLALFLFSMLKDFSNKHQDKTASYAGLNYIFILIRKLLNIKVNFSAEFHTKYLDFQELITKSVTNMQESYEVVAQHFVLAEAHDSDDTIRKMIIDALRDKIRVKPENYELKSIYFQILYMLSAQPDVYFHQLFANKEPNLLKLFTPRLLYRIFSHPSCDQIKYIQLPKDDRPTLYDGHDMRPFLLALIPFDRMRMSLAQGDLNNAEAELQNTLNQDHELVDFFVAQCVLFHQSELLALLMKLPGIKDLASKPNRNFHICITLGYCYLLGLHDFKVDPLMAEGLSLKAKQVSTTSKEEALATDLLVQVRQLSTKQTAESKESKVMAPTKDLKSYAESLLVTLMYKLQSYIKRNSSIFGLGKNPSAMIAIKIKKQLLARGKINYDGFLLERTELLLRQSDESLVKIFDEICATFPRGIETEIYNPSSYEFVCA